MSLSSHTKHSRATRIVLGKISAFALAVTIVGCTYQSPMAHPAISTPAVTAPTTAAPEKYLAAIRSEQIRADCIHGRRIIAGKVLKIVPEGLVVDSGYNDLSRPPLGQSWIVPGNVSVMRNPNVLELNQPDAMCIGLVFLTDVPKRPKPNLYDYVMLVGYPAGEFHFTPLPNVDKTIRRFAAGLDSAVKLVLKDETNRPSANLSH